MWTTQAGVARDGRSEDLADMHEARKAATVQLARALWEVMPGAERPTVNGEYDWKAIEASGHYIFCVVLAENIIKANCAVFK